MSASTVVQKKQYHYLRHFNQTQSLVHVILNNLEIRVAQSVKYALEMGIRNSDRTWLAHRKRARASDKRKIDSRVRAVVYP